MSRIPIPHSIEEAPAASRPHLDTVHALLGATPNMFRLVAASPAAIDAMAGFWGALSKGELDAATRERIALAVANVNGCDYCNSAHSYLARNVAKLGEAEIDANREGRSSDPKADAALRFARKLAVERGAVSTDDIAAVRAAGYSDAALVEIVATVALNVFTNYINEAFKTDIDFPVAQARRAA